VKVAATNHKRAESVLVVVYTHDGKVLLMRRVDHPDFWQSVTGSLAWDETDPRDTAIRELAEETGITEISGLRDLEIDNDYEIFPEWRHRYAPGTTRNIEHVFVLELPTTVPVQLNPDEHSDYRWLKFDSAIALATSYTNRDAIQLVWDRVQGTTNV
jgi:dATP pyrophosphohydrolase